MKCYSFDFFHPLKNVRIFLSLQAIQNQAAGKIWPVWYLLLPSLAKCLAWKWCSPSTLACVLQLTDTRNWHPLKIPCLFLPIGHVSCIFCYWKCPLQFLFVCFNFLFSELLFVLQDRRSALQNRSQLFSRSKRRDGDFGEGTSLCVSMELCIYH